MYEEIHIFNVNTVNEEVEQEFHEFFYKYNLLPLFTNEHRASPITVTDSDARSVIKPSNSYHKVLIEFSDLMNMASDNKMYESALFKIIYNANTFQGMMNQIKRLIKFIANEIDNKHLFNTWNIVWYTKEVY